MSTVLELLSGFIMNFMITVFASIVPLVFGIILSLFAKKRAVVSKVYSWLSLPFESISIPVCILTFYYLINYIGIGFIDKIDSVIYGTFGITRFSEIIIAVMVISTAYLWYIPARYDINSSYFKNIMYNGLGLICAIFKWSFVVGIVGISDLINTGRMLVAYAYNPLVILMPFVITCVCVFVLELAKRFIKQFVK